MTGFLCLECKNVFAEPERHTVHGDPASGEDYFVTIQSCPDCGDEDLQEITLCTDCAECGVDAEATHGEFCAAHFAEEQVCEAERREDFRRDLSQPVAVLTRKQA